MDHDVAVIGAGPSGLATAARLVAAGHQVTMLDRAAAAGGNWRNRYDGFRLNTVRWFSHLPGLRIPVRSGRWVGRDDFVSYLERYAVHHRLRLQPGVTVQRIDPARPDRRGWQLATDQGTVTATGLVVATGAFDVPVLPDWPGLPRFTGEFCHAADYRRPAPYQGRSVLVVGAGATGLEIAALLASGGAARVYLSVRSCQNLFPRQWHGLPLTPAPAAQHLPTALLDAGGAVLHRLLGRDWPAPLPGPPARLGTALHHHGREPVVADGVVDALRAGRIELVPEVTDLLGVQVRLAGGRTLEPAAVIAATGYRSGLAELVGHLGVLGPAGLPCEPGGGRIRQAPGLAFVGFEPTVTGRLLRLPAQVRRAARTVTAG